MMDGLGLRPLVWCGPGQWCLEKKSESLNAKGSEGVWRILGPAWLASSGTDHHPQDSAATWPSMANRAVEESIANLARSRHFGTKYGYCPIFHETCPSHQGLLSFDILTFMDMMVNPIGMDNGRLFSPTFNVNQSMDVLGCRLLQPACRFLLDPHILY